MRNIAEASGIQSQVDIDNEALRKLIRAYCRESGVRNLQKHIEKVKVFVIAFCCHQLAYFRGSFYWSILLTLFTDLL